VIPVFFYLPDFGLGQIPINSFGLMMMFGFFAAYRMLAIVFVEHGETAELAESMVFWAALSGILGSKLNYMAGDWHAVSADPLGAFFSSGGFVFYGGFIGGVLGVWLLLRSRGKNFIRMADLTAPALAVGYAVGRLGCLLSGDGDYGMQSDLPWAIGFTQGVVPTEPGVRVHPAPGYETIAALVIAYILLKCLRQKRFIVAGQVFGLYLLLAAIERFFVEMIRIEPIVYASLTQAQLVSIAIAAIGFVLLLRRRPQSS
jgi:phosphatidylglycerol---prolipoprotein diacylglyceryl transferase